MTTSHADDLLAKIRAHNALVGIIGMGYVGLPLALAFVENGFPVLGFDVDPEKVAKLNRGEGTIKHLDGGRIAAAAATGRFTATADFARLGEADAVLICVPTPLTPQREPDMTYVDAAAHQVRATLRPGQLVILESTTYPGTTDERLKSILEGAPRAAVQSSSLVGAGLAPARSSPAEGAHETRASCHAEHGYGPVGRRSRGEIRGLGRRLFRCPEWRFKQPSAPHMRSVAPSLQTTAVTPLTKRFLGSIPAQPGVSPAQRRPAQPGGIALAGSGRCSQRPWWGCERSSAIG